MGRMAAALGVILAGLGPWTARSQVALRGDGAILVNREPFFPVGFVHMSSAGDDQRRSSDLQMIAAGGFNVMQATVKPGDGAFLDEAEALGVRVVASAADPDTSKAAVKSLKGKRSLLGWNVAEDADNGKQFPKDVVALKKDVKALDPDHLTYITCGDHERCGNFFEGGDVIGLKSFPVPDSHLGGTSGIFESARKASEERPRTFIGVIQSWVPKDKRAPNAEEVRNMTYQALIQGARGILFHAYLDKDWDMDRQPDLFNGIRVVASEINSLRAVLLEGKLRRLNPKAEGVYAGVWAHSGRLYLAVANASGEPRRVSIAMPGGVAGPGLPQFRVPPRRLVLEGSILLGELAAGQVHVYMFETR